MSMQTLSDAGLKVQIKALEATRRMAARLRDDEAGQTPTEYLMIVGLMAVVIITVFVFFYWNGIKGAAQTWVNNVKQAVLGTPVTP